MEHAVSVATRVAASNVKVLITGESGVGKDVFARLIHSQSPRCFQPFVALNCAGVAETLLESELFGHVKGSFTGAYRDKIGSFEQAHKGTIFLDEIGDMGLRMQALLLRFLETGELRRVGSDSPSTRVDVRIVSATNRDLRAMVNKGLFRDDLLYRIDVTRIEVPPLRERSQDVPALMDHLMAKCGGSLTFSDAAMRLLESYRWPGNVRELQNVVEQLVSLVSGQTRGAGRSAADDRGQSPRLQARHAGPSSLDCRGSLRRTQFRWDEVLGRCPSALHQSRHHARRSPATHSERDWR